MGGVHNRGPPFLHFSKISPRFLHPDLPMSSSSNPDSDSNDSAAVQEEVNALWDRQLNKKVRQSYRRKMAAFLVYLFAHQQTCLNQQFVQLSAMTSGTTVNDLMPFLDQPNIVVPPVVFSQVTGDLFMNWIVRIRKPDGISKPKSYGAYRSALSNLFRDYQVPMPLSIKDRLKGMFKGLKKTVTDDVACGDGEVRVGKLPLPFGTYTWFARKMLSMEQPVYTYGHLCMLLSWNLMCRFSNTKSICWTHMEWRQDALGIYFAQMKNDQGGDRPRDPRHIYANPCNFVVCPILALGLYMLSFTFSDSPFVFEGGCQDDRFNKFFVNFLSLPDVEAYLRSIGLKPADIGTHSFRKGASTYAASGSTAGPSMVALQLRAGWSMPGVTGTYLRYEAAGDQHTGRTVCGLPVDSASFATLPPHFPAQDFLQGGNPFVQDCLKALFPTYPDHLMLVAEMGLASVVYHWNRGLSALLSPQHRVFSTPLLTVPGMLQTLTSSVRCRYDPFLTCHQYASTPVCPCRMYEPGDRMTPTGVPPHVSLLVNVRHLAEELAQVHDDITAL